MTVAEATAGLESRAGLAATWVDASGGRLLLELPARAGAAAGAGSGSVLASYLHVVGLESGLGSNPVGLDRGQLGPARLVEFRRVGGRVLLVAPNLSFRHAGADVDAKRAARESFAESVLWSAPILAESDGRIVIDLTSLLVADRHGIAKQLGASGQGSFRLDDDRSALLAASCYSFPDNLEFASLLTFAASDPGAEVRRTAPVAEAVSLVQHQSLIRLPDSAFEPRPADPRVGTINVDYVDVGAPLDATTKRALAWAHRVRPGETITYYVDRGAPEPVRSALVEGASWWAEAFAAAGLPGGFRVELLPEDAHPLDVRFNMIQWVHRAQRGWSYGSGIVDPRTGEILKGHVTLGALRVRQDRLIFEGLLGAEETGSGAQSDPIELSLARLRQLAAHEVGHTLGLAHNFAASTVGRASVMDYPAPLIEVDATGALDVSAAYGVGVGTWDHHVIDYLYAPLPRGDARLTRLAEIAASGVERGLPFASDADARPLGSAHPAGHLWDNGADPVAALELAGRVRARGLERFGPRNLRSGRPLAELEELLVPLYLHHRYAAEACAKLVGGVHYSSAVVEAARDPEPLRPVEPARARAALKAIRATLEPEYLDLDDSILAWLVPRAFGMQRGAELFASETQPVFDALGAARSAADFVLAALLAPERCARLVDQHRRDARQPSLEEVLGELSTVAFGGPEGESPRRSELRSVVAQVFVARLIDLGGRAAPQVRARVEAHAQALLEEAADYRSQPDPGGHREMLRRALARFLDEGAGSLPLPSAPPLPPGSPIGSPVGTLGVELGNGLGRASGCCLLISE